MSQPVRRARLQSGRRLAFTVSLDQETIDGLTLIGQGNRSAAIEMLVRNHLDTAAKRRTKPPAPSTAP